MTTEVKVVKGKMDASGLFGPIWIIGWLFTVGFLHLHFWKGLLAIVIWAYYLGAAFAR